MLSKESWNEKGLLIYYLKPPGDICWLSCGVRAFRMYLLVGRGGLLGEVMLNKPNGSSQSEAALTRM